MCRNLMCFCEESASHWAVPPPLPREVECAPDEQTVDVHTAATDGQPPVNGQSTHQQ